MLGRDLLSSPPPSLIADLGWRTGHVYCNPFLSHHLEKPLQDPSFLCSPEDSWGQTSLHRGEACSSGWQMSGRVVGGVLGAHWGLLLAVLTSLDKIYEQ